MGGPFGVPVRADIATAGLPAGSGLPAGTVAAHPAVPARPGAVGSAGTIGPGAGRTGTALAAVDGRATASAAPTTPRRSATAGPPPPLPAPAPVVRTPAKSRRAKRGQGPPPGPPQAPPPGWQAPPGYVPVAVRRRRRWPRRLLVMTLLFGLCCCGVPGYFAKPMWEQYPANAVLPPELADLQLRDDAASTRNAALLEQDMRTAHLLSEDTFAGVYTDPDGKRVTIFGITGFRLSPESDVDAEMARLSEKYQVTEVATRETGVRGEYRRCGTGRDGGTGVVVCAWADHGSLGTAVFTRLSVADSDALLTRIRGDIVVRG